MSTYKLIYFDGRGRGELCRILFVLAKQKFEDVRITYDDWVSYKLKTPFGQLPVLEIDGEQFTQSIALAKYLAIQFGFYGESNIDRLRIDEIVCLIGDFFNEAMKLFNEKDVTKKAELTKNFHEVVVPKYLGFLERKLKQNDSGFFVGKKLSLADLATYDFVYGINRETPALFKDCPKVTALIHTVENLDTLKSYLANRKETSF